MLWKRDLDNDRSKLPNPQQQDAIFRLSGWWLLNTQYELNFRLKTEQSRFVGLFFVRQVLPSFGI